MHGSPGHTVIHMGLATEVTHAPIACIAPGALAEAGGLRCPGLQQPALLQAQPDTGSCSKAGAKAARCRSHAWAVQVVPQWCGQGRQLGQGLHPLHAMLSVPVTHSLTHEPV